MHHLPTPNEFSCRQGLGFLHVNARSLVPKLDVFKTWFLVAKPDIVVVSETWLKPSVTDTVIHIDGYNVFRADRKGRADSDGMSNAFNAHFKKAGHIFDEQ
ncbi:hypothetical protein F7725_017245, partial [Dissostichus mawsoni]